MSFPSGPRFGPYEVEALLGVGGMGEVYRARDTRLDRRVALKVVRPDLASDEMFRERFRREAHVVSRFSHPNVCALYDIGEQDGSAYLVMEYLEGTTLAAALATGPPPIDDALSYAIQIADGLARAHLADIVHRDLKPGNVMLVEDGRVKLLDFGLAKTGAAQGDDLTTTQLSMAGQVVGTVAYMSPEQTQGETVDRRSDIFSFGVLLYELMTGVRPFQGKTNFSILQKINAEPPPAPHLYVPALPEPVTALIQRLLEKLPDRRPQAMTEVAVELRAIARGRGLAVPSAVEPPRAGIGSRWTSRRRLAFAGPAIVLAVLVVILALVPSARIKAFALVERIPLPAGWRSAAGPGESALPRTAFDWASQGRAYLRRFDRPENVDRAITAYQRAIQLEPDNAFAHAGLAEAFVYKTGYAPDPQWDRRAMEAARRSVALNPDLAVTHAVLGLVMVRTKQVEEGAGELRRALALDPGSVFSYIALGGYHTGKGDLVKAEEMHRKALQLAPDDWNAHQQLGRSLYAQARYADATREWEEARRLAPDNVIVLRNLGAVYHMVGRTDEAASALQRALEILPTATVYNNLGTLRFFQGHYTDAAAAFDKAVALNATVYLYWANLGDAYRWIPGKQEKEREAYSRAIALVRERITAAPQDPTFQSQVALYLSKMGDGPASLDELQRWQRLAKKTPASHFRAAMVHEIAGQRAAALEALDAALKGGYSLEEVRSEPELVKLRSDPKYHRLVAGFETRPAR
jgi:tetratricopeptide (TPR) repeat protein/tRNA A-37 threonylcarbamoyl transferase component Bud32